MYPYWAVDKAQRERERKHHEMRDLNYVMASHSSIEYCQLYVEVETTEKSTKKFAYII